MQFRGAHQVADMLRDTGFYTRSIHQDNTQLLDFGEAHAQEPSSMKSSSGLGTATTRACGSRLFQENAWFRPRHVFWPPRV